MEGFVLSPNTAACSVEAHGILSIELAVAGWRMRTFSPSQVKKAAAGSGATRGAGKVTKQDVADGDFERFGWQYDQTQPHWDDLTDAHALAELARIERGLRDGSITAADLHDDATREIFAPSTKALSGLDVPWHGLGRL